MLLQRQIIQDFCPHLLDQVSIMMMLTAFIDTKASKPYWSGFRASRWTAETGPGNCQRWQWQTVVLSDLNSFFGPVTASSSEWHQAGRGGLSVAYATVHWQLVTRPDEAFLTQRSEAAVACATVQPGPMRQLPKDQLPRHDYFPLALEQSLMSSQVTYPSNFQNRSQYLPTINARRKEWEHWRYAPLRLAGISQRRLPASSESPAWPAAWQHDGRIERRIIKLVVFDSVAGFQWISVENAGLSRVLGTRPGKSWLSNLNSSTCRQCPGQW
jgi:hypothetical protein